MIDDSANMWRPPYILQNVLKVECFCHWAHELCVVKIGSGATKIRISQALSFSTVKKTVRFCHVCHFDEKCVNIDMYKYVCTYVFYCISNAYWYFVECWLTFDCCVIKKIFKKFGFETTHIQWFSKIWLNRLDLCTVGPWDSQCLSLWWWRSVWCYASQSSSSDPCWFWTDWSWSSSWKR